MSCRDVDSSGEIDFGELNTALKQRAVISQQSATSIQKIIRGHTERKNASQARMAERLCSLD